MVAPLSLIFAVCSGQTRAAGPAIDLAIAWLPVDTTSLIVSAAPGRSALDRETEPLSSFIFGMVALGVPPGCPRLSYQFAVAGARKNRGPKDLGGFPYEGCIIAGLSSAEADRLATFARTKSQRNGIVGGLPTFVFAASDDPDHLTYYLSFDGPLFFCATDKKYLAELLARRAHPPADRAFPSSLEEWKYIEKDAPFWGIRRFVTPNEKLEAGAVLNDDRLIGTAVSMDAARLKVTAVMISESTFGFEKAQKLWGFLKEEKAPPPLEFVKVDGRTTRIVLDARAPKANAAALLLVFLLGHPALI